MAILALAGLFTFVYLNMCKELTDPDIWLHLKTGKFILSNGIIPHTDPFSAVLAGKTWIDHSWLLQITYSLIFEHIGSDGLLIFSGLILCAAFLFLFLSVYKNKRQIILLTGLLYLTVLAGAIRFNIRPENMSVLFFSIFIFGLSRLIRSRWLYILVFVELLWVNCHGFFILGPSLLGISLIWLKDKRSFNNLRNVFLLTLAACLINPYAVNGAIYPIRIMFNNNSAIFYTQIRELLPTWRLNLATMCPYFLLIAVSLTVMFLNRRRLNLSRVIFWLILLGISLGINRNIIYFNFFAFFMTAELIGQNNKEPLDSQPACKNLIGLIVAGMILFSVVNMNETLLKSRYYIAKERRYKSALMGINTYRFPGEAADFVLKQGLPGNLFNFFNEGSYLIFRLGPERKVFIDGRTELYGGAFYRKYLNILKCDEINISELFDKHKVNTVFLSGTALDIEDLAVYFYQRPNQWCLVYLGPDALIFIRNSPENILFIRQLRIDLRNWQTKRTPAEQLRLDSSWPNPYVRRAWIFYYFKLYDQSLQEIQEAVRILPSCSDAYIIRGKIYTREKNFLKAYEALRLAHIYSPKDLETLIALGEFYLAKGEFDKAIRAGKTITSEFPKFAKGFCLLAQSYIKQNKIQPALAAMEQAFKLDLNISGYSKQLSDLTANAPNTLNPNKPSGSTFTRWIKKLLNLR